MRELSRTEKGVNNMKRASRVPKRIFIHPYLMSWAKDWDMWKTSLMINVPLVFVLHLFDVYPSWLKGFEFGVLICMVLATLLYPLMITGKIKAYYQETFETTQFMVISYFYMRGVVVRTMVVCALHLWLVFRKKANPYEYASQWRVFKEEVLLNTYPIAIGVLFGLFFLWQFFYREKFIEIKRYHNLVHGYMLKQKKTFQDACNMANSHRIAEMRSGAVREVEDKINVNPPRHAVQEPQQPPQQQPVRQEVEMVQTVAPAGTAKANGTLENPIYDSTPMRRRAREK